MSFKEKRTPASSAAPLVVPLLRLLGWGGGINEVAWFPAGPATKDAGTGGIGVVGSEGGDGSLEVC